MHQHYSIAVYAITLARQLSDLHHLSLIRLWFLFAFIFEMLKFLFPQLVFLRQNRPRLNFAGPKQTVEDGAKCVDGCAEVEYQPPCSKCLLQQKTVQCSNSQKRKNSQRTEKLSAPEGPIKGLGLHVKCRKPRN